MKGPAGEVRRILHDSRLAKGDGLMVKLLDGNDDTQAAALAGTFWRVLAGMAYGCAQF